MLCDDRVIGVSIEPPHPPALDGRDGVPAQPLMPTGSGEDLTPWSPKREAPWWKGAGRQAQIALAAGVTAIGFWLAPAGATFAQEAPRETTDGRPPQADTPTDDPQPPAANRERPIALDEDGAEADRAEVDGAEADGAEADGAEADGAETDGAAAGATAPEGPGDDGDDGDDGNAPNRRTRPADHGGDNTTDDPNGAGDVGNPADPSDAGNPSDAGGGSNPADSSQTGGAGETDGTSETGGGDRQRDGVAAGGSVPTARPSTLPPRPATTASTTAPCLRPAVTIVRPGRGRNREEGRLALTHCNGWPNLAALDELSTLARPHDVDRPAPQSARDRSARRATEGEVATGIRRLDPGLLIRLQAIADRFRGRAIEIVSGFRPRARRNSRHRVGRALDLRVAGVNREVLVRFARDLPDTGVGYYPNSSLTHVDVRPRQAYWIDRSGPGERADYGTWPPTHQETREARASIESEVDAALRSLAPSASPSPNDGAGTARGIVSRATVSSAPSPGGAARPQGTTMDAATSPRSADHGEANQIRDEALRAVDEAFRNVHRTTES